MIIIEDTRNQTNKHRNIHKWCKENGIEIIRSKLVVGDYTLPTNQTVCIDTKQNLEEVYGNLIQQHERFRAECVQAQKIGVKLIILVEHRGINSLADVEHWENPLKRKYDFISCAHEHGKMLNVRIPKKPPVPSKNLMVIMSTMEKRYGIEWQFCDKSETGRRIIEILQEENING